MLEFNEPFPEEMTELHNPLRNSEFRKLFTAQVIALVGTGLATVALTLLAYDMVGGNAGVLLGQALAIKMVAYVVFAPIVGGIAHRFNRKPLLITLDLMRAIIVLAMPFATEVWHIFVLIFLLNVFSAGFKPVFQATIPDIINEEQAYTRALSFSRLAYDLENLISPALAGLALLFFTYDFLFISNSIAFLVSASLILVTVLPGGESVDRLGGLWQEISFGVRSYLKTPRLRGLLVLYLGVACTSAMVIVNTVVYIREILQRSDSDVAMALAASGAGSMIAALSLPRVLNHISDRTVMLSGAIIMSLGLMTIWLSPDFVTLLAIWFMIGLGLSLVQTPSGRIVNQSSAPTDRPSYFSAQFALSHACWMLAYPVAGQLGHLIGIETTALMLGILVTLFSIVAALVWPRNDPEVIEHSHTDVSHRHQHTHDIHHDHFHNSDDATEDHNHHHTPLTHSHLFVIDDHHPRWPE